MGRRWPRRIEHPRRWRSWIRMGMALPKSRLGRRKSKLEQPRSRLAQQTSLRIGMERSSRLEQRQQRRLQGREQQRI